jgi:hypothetical protein
MERRLRPETGCRASFLFVRLYEEIGSDYDLIRGLR